MIVILNNCLQLVELGSQLEKQYSTSSSIHDLNETFGRLRATFIQLRNEIVNYLLEELFVDLDQHFDKLFTVLWVTSNVSADTIYATIEDYFQDYSKLKEANYKYVVEQTRGMVGKRYLTALLSKRTSFKTLEESMKAAMKIVKEAERLKHLFDNLGNDFVGDDPFEAINMMAELLKSDDDMLSGIA